MTWERDPLWAKARLFFERGFSCESREDADFGLWCSFGLELLARAVLASVSPALLAEPEPTHRHLLYALSRSSEGNPKSLGAARVLALCSKLFSEFTQEDLNASLALINRRNEELHSGSAAFQEYRPGQWLAGFYHACKTLATTLGETLVSLFGEDEARAAEEILKSDRDGVGTRVSAALLAHREAFAAKPIEEQRDLRNTAEKLALEYAKKRHHRVSCPACECTGRVEGVPFGRERVTHGDREIIVRQMVSPRAFSCEACGLKLRNYAELDIAGLGGQYTRRTTYTPEEYYGLVDPEDIPSDVIDSYVQAYLDGLDEYDNE